MVAAALAIVLALPNPDPASLAPTAAESAAAARLVADLGSPKFAVRDAAQKELARMGYAALPALERTFDDARSFPHRAGGTTVDERVQDFALAAALRLRLHRPESFGFTDALAAGLHAPPAHRFILPTPEARRRAFIRYGFLKLAG